jgi:hypothetical protein
MRLCFLVPVYEDVCVVSVGAKEDCLIVYLLIGLPRYFLDDFKKLSTLQSYPKSTRIGKKPTVLVMPSLNFSISTGPSKCSHFG